MSLIGHNYLTINGLLFINCNIGNQVRGKDLKNIKYDSNRAKSLAIGLLAKHYKHVSKSAILDMLVALRAKPEEYLDDPVLELTGEELIVHRKGATPATTGELGIIPGSMTAVGYIVKGKGEAGSLFSASHGAGRKMSRKKAQESYTGSEMKKVLSKEGISLIGGGVDEAPVAYKNIEEVMHYQQDLVDVIGKFTPRIVRMDKN